MPILRALVSARNIVENLLAMAGGEQRLTGTLYISEPLQKAGTQLENEHAPVRWLSQHIPRPDGNASSQQVHLEGSKHLIQIVTVHKSEGLEYPLVWLPFIINSHVQGQAFYHDHHSSEAVLGLDAAPESVDFAEIEYLAGDLCLLYVALTRLVWHYSLGVTPLVCRRGDKRSDTDVHQGALGRLLQKGESQDAIGLRTCTEALCDDDIAWQTVQTDDNQPQQVNDVLTAELDARTLQ